MNVEVRGTARLMVSVGAVLALAACGTPSAGADACPQTYPGQRVNLKGTVTAVLAIGGYFLTIARDSTGQTCQLVMPSNPGTPGASISLQGFVAFVSPGTPPVSSSAPVYVAALMTTGG